MQAKLWDNIRNTKFEDIYAMTELDIATALSKLDKFIYRKHKSNNVFTS